MLIVILNVGYKMFYQSQRLQLGGQIHYISSWDISPAAGWCGVVSNCVEWLCISIPSDADALCPLPLSNLSSRCLPGGSSLIPSLLDWSNFRRYFAREQTPPNLTGDKLCMSRKCIFWKVALVWQDYFQYQIEWGKIWIYGRLYPEVVHEADTLFTLCANNP